MHKRACLWTIPMIPLAAVIPLAAGCRTAPTHEVKDSIHVQDGHVREGGPRIRPDESTWKRTSAPLPPFYLDFTSASGRQWTMVTPLYWQVKGPPAGAGVGGVSEREEAHYHVLPLAHYSRTPSADSTGGHVLNYFWGQDHDKRFKVLFPLWWDFEGEKSRTSVVGPLYTRETEAGRRRTVLFPWLFSRETDPNGYDYWGVCFRLLGLEKQVFEGEERKRLWLFFVFKLPLA